MMLSTSAPHRAFEATSAQIEVVARAVKSDAAESEPSDVSELETTLVSASASTFESASPPHDAKNKPIAANPARYRRER